MLAFTFALSQFSSLTAVAVKGQLAVTTSRAHVATASRVSGYPPVEWRLDTSPAVRARP
jgi:hypothetical protein